MKQLLALFAILAFTSCYERGEILTQPTDFIIIHGKTYKLVQIVPAKGEHPIWIMYPKDSTDDMPTVINYDEQNGKVINNKTVIKID